VVSACLCCILTALLYAFSVYFKVDFASFNSSFALLYALAASSSLIVFVLKSSFPVLNAAPSLFSIFSRVVVAFVSASFFFKAYSVVRLSIF